MSDAATPAPCARCGQVHARCTAHKKHRDAHGNLVPCTGARVRGRRVCRMHGGTQKAGIASPHFKHGRRIRSTSPYMSVMPTAMRRYYDAARKDVLSLDRNLRALDADEMDLLARMAAGEGVSVKASDLREALEAFDTATDQRNGAAVLKATRELVELTRRMIEPLTVREQWRASQDLRARIVRVESQRLKDQHEMVSADRFAEFARAFLLAIGIHITDAGLRARIQEDANRVMLNHHVQHMLAAKGA